MARTLWHGYCEDYPACGHTNSDPCDGVVVQTGAEWAHDNYCDSCGYSHLGVCRDDYDEEPDDA